MKIVTISSKEEQVGKSVIAVHLAHYLRELDKSVLVIDLDYKGSSSCALREYASNVAVPELFAPDCQALRQHEGITLVRANLADDMRRWMRGDFGGPLEDMASTLQKNLEVVAPGFDYCIVDTSPGLCTRARAALVASDFVLTPVGSNDMAPHRVSSFFADIADIQDRHTTRLAVAGLLPSRVQAADHERLQEDPQARFPDHLLSAHIAEGRRIPEALRSRMPVWRSPRWSARGEAKNMRAALATVAPRIGVC